MTVATLLCHQTDKIMHFYLPFTETAYVCVLLQYCRYFVNAPSTDAVSAFNRMEKGISDFSHYPKNCGKRLAGVRSQTNLMQSPPQGERWMERDEERKTERVTDWRRQKDGLEWWMKERYEENNKSWEQVGWDSLCYSRLDWHWSIISALPAGDRESKRNTRTWRHGETVKKTERATEREERWLLVSSDFLRHLSQNKLWAPASGTTHIHTFWYFLFLL